MKAFLLVIFICSLFTVWITLTSATKPNIQRRQTLLSRHLRESSALAEKEPVKEPTSPSSESKSEAEPENNSTSEPEPEAEAESWPEPGPVWKEAYNTWKSAWGIHVYTFATCYLLMSFYAAYYVLFNVYDGLDKKYLSVSLNIMVFLFCLTRAFILYLDPYHQGGLIKALQLMRLIWSIGGPCLTASDSLIILALLETSQQKITLPALQKGSVIAVIVTAHFVFVILTDFVVSEYVSAKGMILFCQVFFVTWGSVLGTGYIRLGYVLDKKLFDHKPKKEKQDKLYVFLIYASGVANYGLVIIMIYSSVGVFGVYSDVKFVDAWSWWTLQTVSRLSEVITCILIFTVSAKRTRIKKAVDDLSNMESQIPDTPKQSVTRSEKMRKMFKRTKLITVKPVENPSPSAPPRRARRMSMFSHLDTESKAAIGLGLEMSHARGSPTGSTDTQDTIDLEENRDHDRFNTWISAQDGEANWCQPTPKHIFTNKRASTRFPQNQNRFTDILEENEGGVIEDNTTHAHPSFVRSISNQVLRKLSGLSAVSKSPVCEDEGECIIQQSEMQGASHNVGFCDDGLEQQDLPNTVS